MSGVDLKPGYNSIQPKHWLSTTFEEVTDPTHTERWARLMKREPEFAREILARALHEASSNNPGESKKYVDAMTWVADVFLRASENN